MSRLSDYRRATALISAEWLRMVLRMAKYSVMCSVLGAATPALGNDTSPNERVVRDFIAAWSELDAAALVDYFAVDGVYHNMMLEPVAGREKLLEFITSFLSGWSETHWEVINLVSRGDLVVAERVDRTRVGEKWVDLPCVGVFELEDGEIKIWRDYFDLSTYRDAF